MNYTEDGGTVLGRVVRSRKIVVSEELCKGCGICIALCPLKVLGKSHKLSSRGVYPPMPISNNRCTGCRICEHYCPDFAVYVVREGKK